MYILYVHLVFSYFFKYVTYLSKITKLFWESNKCITNIPRIIKHAYFWVHIYIINSYI